jgi:protein-tyrosine phosphatase
MVDIHSHILPGWDDGSRSLDESLSMLRIAAEAGTTDIVATPHANSEFPYDAAVIQDRFEELRSAVGDLIRVHLACDFHLSFENVHDAIEHPDKYTINHKSYLMVELPDMIAPESARTVMSRLHQSGITCVITHPERNPRMRVKLDVLRQCVQDGALVQITGQSLLGRFGNESKACAHQMFKQGLVHFIASDAHDCEDRPPRLDLARKYVDDRFGTTLAERLFDANPRAALFGDYIDDNLSGNPEPNRKWYEFWS